MKRGVKLFSNKLAGAFRKNFYIFMGIFLFAILTSLFIYAFPGASSGTPFIELKSPFNNKIDLDGNIIFAYNVTDPVAEIANCSLIFDGSINQTNSSINKSKINYFTLENIPNGEYNWSINCTNDAGDENSSESWIITVYIDTTSPTVTLNGPVDDSKDSDGNVVFNYTVNDDGWLTNCSLYTDISGTWQINQTNTFVEKNASLYFTLNNIADDTTFKWNVVCYDFALFPNYDWTNSNWTLTIDNSAPESSTIPDQTWQEDTIKTINLSDYFSDPDGDDLDYSSTKPQNINVSINNNTGIATLTPDNNWQGTRYIVFYAFDAIQNNASSNNVILTVQEFSGGRAPAPPNDNLPSAISNSPPDKFNDTDGFVTFTCNATDDYGLGGISLYTNTTGTWVLNQTEDVTGLANSINFILTNLSDGSYLWACEAYDNANQSSWSENRTVNVKITADLSHDISSYTINHLDHNRTIVITYSSYLNNSITLGDLTVYLSNGSIYFNKNISTSSGFEINSTDSPIMVHSEKIRINYNEIFYGNFTVGNQEWINITLKYYYRGNQYQVSAKHTIEIKPPLPTP